jgi:hypothetical protein
MAIPTLQIRPCFSNSLALKILFQTKDTQGPIEVSMNDEFRKYLTLKILAMRELGFCIIRHPYLARRAWLKRTKSLKPRPPANLDQPILSQFI